MPNIEIHGLPRRQAETTAARIFDKLREKPYAEDVVVTIYPTTVINIIGKHMPFLRIVSTPLPQLEEIVKLLKLLGIDIEVPQELTAFYPKEQYSLHPLGHKSVMEELVGAGLDGEVLKG